MATVEACKCAACSERYARGLPVLKKISDDNASHLARSFATKIFRSHHVLKHATEHHWSILAGRWKFISDPEAFLKSVLPDIPEQHRPDFLFLQQARGSPIKRRDIDTPQINIEDLLEDENSLLEFIKSRSECHPGEFIFRDAQYGGLKPEGFHFGQAVSERPMLCYGQTEAETYAAFKSPAELRAENKDHLGVLPALALSALQIQTNIMKFLDNCCRKILPEVDFENAPAEPTVSSAPRRFRDGSWLSNHRLTANIAYLPMGQIRLPELKYLVEGMILASEDHICSLLANPQYLLGAFREASKHWLKNDKCLLDRAKQAIAADDEEGGHPFHAKVARPILKRVASVHRMDIHAAKKRKIETATYDRWNWGRVMEWVIADAHIQLLLWKAMDEQLQVVEGLLYACKLEETATRLPEELEFALRKLEQLVATLDEWSRAPLKRGLPTSEQLRHLYETDPNTPPEQVSVVDAKLRSKTLTRAESRVHNTACALLDYSKRFHNVHVIVDEFRHMLQTDAEAAALISNWNINYFHKIAACSAIVDEFNMFFPWKLGWRRNIAPERVLEALKGLQAASRAISDAALVSSVENPILPHSKDMQHWIAEKSPAKQAEKQIIGIEKKCDAFVHGFYDAFSNLMGSDDPFIVHLEELIGRYGRPSRIGDDGAELVQATGRLALTTKDKRSKSKVEKAAVDLTSTSSRGFIKVAIDKGDAKRALEPDVPIELHLHPDLVKIYYTLRTIPAPNDTTELDFLDFSRLMDAMGLDCFEMCWPGHLFYPREGAQIRRGFFILAPHKNNGKWTAKEMPAVVFQFCNWLDGLPAPAQEK